MNVTVAHRKTSFGRRLRLVAAAAMALCSASGAARAGDAENAGGVSGVLETLNLKAKVGSMPDFIEKTRPDPDHLDFIPAGAPHPKREIKAKTPEEVEAAKAALDAAAKAQLAPKKPPATSDANGARKKKPVKAARRSGGSATDAVAPAAAAGADTPAN